MEERKKILIISYYWPPSGGAGVQRWLKFVKYLPQFGFDPIVITVDEKAANYPLLDHTLLTEVAENVRVYRTKTAEPFGIYKKLSRRKSVPHSGFSGEKKSGLADKFFKFIRGNFFIPDARKGWNKYAFKTAEKILQHEQIDCIITTSPPHSTQLIGLKLKKKFKVQWIADLRDPWTDIYYYKELMHTAFAKKRDRAYELQTLGQADRVIVVSESIKRLFAAKLKQSNPAKIEVIPNGFDTDDFSTIAFTQTDTTCWTISYVGNLSEIYPVNAFVRAFSRLVKSRADCRVRFVFVGNASLSLTRQISEEELEQYVVFHPYVPHLEAIGFLAKSNMLLLVIPDVEHNEGILTGKLFEYLAVQKTILCVGPPTCDAAKIIDSAKAGNTFSYDQEEAMFAFMNKELDLWKAGDTKAMNSNVHQFSREALTAQLASVIRSL